MVAGGDMMSGMAVWLAESGVEPPGTTTVARQTAGREDMAVAQ